MRTESPTSVTPTVKRVLNRLVVAKRSVWARGPVVRWVAVLGTSAAIGGLGYLATIPAPGKYLGEGREYPIDAVPRITRALDLAHIEYRDEGRRIGVASDRYTEAMDVVSKLELDRRSIPEIRKEAHATGFWETAQEKDRRELRAKEEILEAIISNLDDEIVSAYVEVLRVPSKMGMRPTSTTTACVILETKDSRVIGPKTVQSIKDIIVADVPSLKADGVTVLDRKGRKYLDPSNPALDELSRTRAREEELAQELLEQIDWINGAQVTVKMVTPPVPEPVEEVKKPASASVAEPQVGVNQPLESEPEPPAPEMPAPPVEPKTPPKADFARIWVKVPRSFYFKKALPNHNPSKEELEEIKGRTEATIKRAPSYVLAPGTFEILVDMIQDDVVIRDPLVAPTVPETRRIPSWWVPAGVGAGVAAVLLIVALRLLALRRPKKDVAAEPSRIRFAVDANEDSGDGASERVRELIRHNPEAAASVLHRWIGQGGRAA